jgi:hypothetical protein
MRAVKKLSGQQSGIALLTALLLLLLLSSMLVGFMLLVTSGQRSAGMDNDYNKAFYGAEAGMEKITSELGTLFNDNYAPTGAEVNAIATAPPVIPGIQYYDQSNNSTYQITYPQDASGNPLAAYAQITSGSSPYQGMSALETPYTLTVTSRTPSGSEVKLQRTTQTVGIPLFQFGVFSQTDLSYFPGPNFNFGGRVQSNGNLFLASAGPANATPTQAGVAQLWLSQRVTVVGDVIRDTLSNGHPLSTTSEHPGSVEITTGAGSYQALGFGQGSQIAGLGSGANPNWPAISASYNSNLRNGVKPLNMSIVLVSNGTAQPIDMIRRPVQNEDTSNPAVLGERYFAQASLKILISDNPNDITELPCVSAGAPFNLALLSSSVANLTSSTADPSIKNLVAAMNAAGTQVLPLATSGATSGAYLAGAGAGPSPGDGYWQPNGTPVITGYIKIDAQTGYGSPCGTWKDVTQEILSLGYAGRNLNPIYQSSDGLSVNPNWTYQGASGGSATWLPASPSSELSPSTCADPHPNAVIRLERMRDNPSSVAYNQPTGKSGWLPAKSAVKNMCGVDTSTSPPTVSATAPSDYWPNALFDTREGWNRESTPAAPYVTSVTLGGTMQYVELDINNLARWLTGAIGTSGPSTKDPVSAPNDFSVYFSDRRGNYAPAGSVPGTWPPRSPSGNETGEYGYSDFINPNDINGCPDGVLDPGEDVDGLGATGFFTYGEQSFPNGLQVSTGTNTVPLANTLFANALSATMADPKCTGTAGISPWPGTWLVNKNEARENPVPLFRRALKLVNGSAINVGNCPGGVPCGLTVATENPMYVQGDFNANSAGGGFNDLDVAASVIADAVTLLSNNYNDVNSFAFPFQHNSGAPLERNATTSWYRMGVVAGKEESFPIPNWDSTAIDSSQDFGTDGGVHNFLRFIEDWGNATLNYDGSLLEMYYNRQALGIYHGGPIYSPPTRAYQFDTNFLTPSLLPPRTPMFRDINTTGFTQLLLPNQ